MTLDKKGAAEHDRHQPRSPAPDGGYGWIIVLAAFLLQGISVGLALSVGIYYTEWLDVYEAGPITTAWVTSINTGMLFFGGPAACVLSERWSHRTVCILGSLLAASGLFSSAFASSIYVLYITYSLIAGIGYSLMYVPSVVIVGEYFEARRAIAMPLSVSGVGIFCLVLPPVLRVLIGQYGWRGCMMISAGLALNGAVFGALFIPPSKSLHRKEDAVESASGSCNTSLLRNLTFWLFFTNQFLWNMGSLILFVLVVDFARESGIDKDHGALLLSAVGISGTVGRLVTVVLARYVKRLLLYNGATLMTGIAIALIPAHSSLAMFSTCCCTYGFCFGMQVALLGILTADLFSVEHLNSAYGYLSISNGLGALLGPPIAGQFYYLGQSYAVPFYFGGAISVLATLLMVPISRRQRPTTSVLSEKDIDALNSLKDIEQI